MTPQGVRTYVLDTSVLLSDPGAFFRFAEHTVVVPLTVIVELEGKRHDPELGYFARRALRHLDDLRVAHGRLDLPMPIGDGGTLRVELSDADASALPAGMRLGDNDTRILAAAASIAADGEDVTVVSKDLPMRVKASAAGLSAEEYRADQVIESGWTGVAELAISGDEMSDLYETEIATSDAVRGMPVNTGLVIHSERGSALGRVTDADGEYRLVRGDRDVFGLHGRSAEQRLAIDLLLDPAVGIVSLGGRAGTGKSALALCAGLEAVLERQQHRRIVVFRPLYAVGGQELGYLPGDQQEKMSPWGQAVFDTLGSVVSGNVVEEVMARGILEVLPLTHIRGRTLHDAFVIVDEAQSLERNVLLTVLSRIGQNSRVVLTHDVGQRDNLHVGRHDGVASVIETLKDHDLFGHVTLTRSERSAVAALVTRLLEAGELS
ncbi:MAG TPA: PhoH family protein [Microbacterium sp.]|uniref:PhoH family protein n=1 Tax=Microbacterium sp. TaxID=51671 RepID=UPI002B48F41E|nr:PhoH family protein [Microbacterium sp.]HKT57423.1 PhoH family protein [Microbacterium sp.]